MAGAAPHEARRRRARLPPARRRWRRRLPAPQRELPAPAVLLYSAYADAALAIPAVLAGVDGLVDKAAPAGEFYDAIRRVARGERVLPAISRELLDAATEVLAVDELPILAMALEHTPVVEMAGALGIDPLTVSRRLDHMIGPAEGRRARAPLGDCARCSWRRAVLTVVTGLERRRRRRRGHR